MGSVIDLDARRARKNGNANGVVIPESRVPTMTIHFYTGPGAPLRIVGVPHQPTELRAAAVRAMNACMSLMAEAHRLDGDKGELPRLVCTLFANGKLTAQSYNGPNGDETRDTLKWMRGCAPYLQDLILSLTKEKLHAPIQPERT